MKMDEFYSFKKILALNPHYAIVIGERSNGKTYGALKMAIENYYNKGEQTALVRRWQDDFKGKRGQVMFDALVANKEVEKITKGEWNGIFYYAYKWYLCRTNEDGEVIKDSTPFCYAFAISAQEHDKSTSYPLITLIIFDEFITRGAYLPDEFVLFMNVISTIARRRKNVKILMLANTVNKWCPYFEEMGLHNIRNQLQGTIDVYSYGESELRVAVEYCDSLEKRKENNFLWAFNNPKLSMIQSGSWEIDIYPHCPREYNKYKDIVFSYFVEFSGDMLQCDIIATDEAMFTFIHRKTGELKHPESDLIYSATYDPRPNWKRNLLKPSSPLENKILQMWRNEKIFYQDNEIGEIMRNYIETCKST